MKQYTSFPEFINDFQTINHCRAFLCEQKWGNGFTCRKCGHTTSVKGRTWYYRKCQKCHYDESCTAHTLFHKIKFSLVKAFYITYQLSTMKKGMATTEIARQYDIHQETAWFFKRKVQEAMSQGKRQMLLLNVEVDETSIGGKEKGAPGRSHGKKKKVLVAAELEYPEEDSDKPKIKSAQAITIEGYAANELKRAIDQVVDEQAIITTDGLPAYKKALKGREHMDFLSNSGSNFVQLHWHIFNLKNWIRGIHHHISNKHVQKYLDEYHYRFNRRNQIQSLPMRVLNRMVNNPWLPYSQAIAT